MKEIGVMKDGGGLSKVLFSPCLLFTVLSSSTSFLKLKALPHIFIYLGGFGESKVFKIILV